MTAVKALATTEDRASMVRGVRIALKIAGQRALRQHQRAVHLAPASDSETDIWDFVKRRSHGLYRQSRPHLTRSTGPRIAIFPPWARACDAGTVGVKVESRAVRGQRRAASCVAGVVHCRTKVDRRRPGFEGAVPRRDPDVSHANSSIGAIGNQKELQPIPSYVCSVILIPAGAAQLRDEDGGAERPIIPQRADPDAENPGTVTRDVQADDPGLFVLEVGRGVIILRTIDRAEVDRLLPTEIVMLVASSRNIEIVAAETTWAVTVEEQQMPVRRKARDGRAAIDAIDDGYTVECIQIYWWSPIRVEAGALGNPDFEEARGVLAVDAPRRRPHPRRPHRPRHDDRPHPRRPSPIAGCGDCVIARQVPADPVFIRS